MNIFNFAVACVEKRDGIVRGKMQRHAVERNKTSFSLHDDKTRCLPTPTRILQPNTYFRSTRKLNMWLQENVCKLLRYLTEECTINGSSNGGCRSDVQFAFAAT